MMSRCRTAIRRDSTLTKGAQRMSNLPRTSVEYRVWWAEQTDMPYGYCWCGCGERTPVAKTTAKKRLVFSNEPYRYRPGHHTIIKPRSLSERFWPKVLRQPDGCWRWIGFVYKEGYGRIRSSGGRSGESLYAHRVSYEMAHEPIPDGLELDHLCRNRWCVSRAHLEAVTHSENVRRGQAPTMLLHLRQVCANGHSQTEENAYRSPKGKGYCRICRRARRQRKRVSESSDTAL